MYSDLPEDRGDFGYSYHNSDSYDGSYGYNYRSYRQNDSLKGKVEQKYWKTKQKVIEKLGKSQDEFVVAGDAEVDSRLEAFKHIQHTCQQLMVAVEVYQNRIFALSQDENEMGRFLRDQGSTDKTKAGKMMIAVGKGQSFAAQQRLSLRVPLVRLYQELETFRFRAISDTMITVQRMEDSRSEYRAAMLWMADISRELDPDVDKRLDKYREVQVKVKGHKKKFDKLKGDVVQKIDLLSASRCNLLSSTLAAYQQSMLKFLEQSTKTYTSVLDQFKGYPSYQFQILKHIIPNNGVVDDEDEEEPKERGDRKNEKRDKDVEEATEAVERGKESPYNARKSSRQEQNDAKLISFDHSPSEEEVLNDRLAKTRDSTSDKKEVDLLGLYEENNQQAREPEHGLFGDFESSDQSHRAKSDFDDLLGNYDKNQRHSQGGRGRMEQSRYDASSELLGGSLSGGKGPSSEVQSVDDLLFGSSEKSSMNQGMTEMDILGEILGGTSISEQGEEPSFSRQWQEMFGENNISGTATPTENIETTTESSSIYLPSFLMDQLRETNPVAAEQGAPREFSSVSEMDMSRSEAMRSVSGSSAAPSNKGMKPKDTKRGKGQDMAAWFNLFSDLDPLSNPDAIGKGKDMEEQRSC